MGKKELIEELSDIFFPCGIKCIVCGNDIPQGKRFPVCNKCNLEHNEKFCLRCGRNSKVSLQYCINCKDKRWNFEIARAPFVYCGEVKHLIHRLKYGNCRYIAKEVTVYLADMYFECGLTSDIITYVPMHPKKQKMRGYNQAEELARCLSEAVNCPFDSLLTKNAYTKSNASQNSEQRLNSVKDSFDLVETNGRPVSLSGKKILLVDDVFTTGATVNECARMLKEAKADEVKVLTLATAFGGIKVNKGVGEKALKHIREVK